MATLTEHKPGDFCWMELGTTDQQAAKAFYGALLGWTAQDTPMGPAEVYTTFELRGRATGGGYRVGQGSQMPEIPPHWDIYIAVSSAAETAAKAADAGGIVLKEPFDVYTLGSMAVIQDPTGAIFCIWEAKQHPGIAVKDEAGAFCWADLNTPNPAKARDFYAKVFGWTIEGGQGQESEYLHIRNGANFIGGIPPAAYHQPGVPAHWMIYFKAADCAAETRKAEQLGAKVLLPALSMPNVGVFSVLADPQGAGFALYESVTAATA
jgi:predicted enzyme related to lactoylglutathione lyase